MFVRKLLQHLKGTSNGNNLWKTNTFKFQSQSSMIRSDPFDSVLSVAHFCKWKFHRFQILRSTMFTNILTKRIFQGHGMWEVLGLVCLPRLVPDKVRHLAPWSPRCFHDLYPTGSEERSLLNFSKGGFSMCFCWPCYRLAWRNGISLGFGCIGYVSLPRKLLLQALLILQEILGRFKQMYDINMWSNARMRYSKILKWMYTQSKSF